MTRPAIILFLLFVRTAFAELPEPEVQRVVNAIWRVEGRDASRYGIKSVKPRSLAHAREICRRTVINNRKAWEYDGRPGEWIEYLGAQYCPAITDPVGHRNWMRNMRRILVRIP